MAKGLIGSAIGIGNSIFAAAGIQVAGYGGLAALGATGVAATAVFGAAVNALTPKPTIKTEGQRLQDSRVTSAAEGQPINELYGTFRVGGNIIWATRLKENVVKDSSGGGKKSPKVESTNYKYTASFAIALCKGEVDSLNSIYFDGQLQSLSRLPYEFYHGTQDQIPNATIESVEGSGNVPAYKGLCYIVFTNIDLTNYGNRVPQVSCVLRKNSDLEDNGEIPVANILQDLCLKAGLTLDEIDTTDLDMSCKGFLVRDVNSYREAIEQLFPYFSLEAVKEGGKIVFRKKFSPSTYQVLLDDVVTSEDNPFGISISTKQKEEMLKQVAVSFVDASKQYSTGSVYSEVLDEGQQEISEFSSMVSYSAGAARNLSNILLLEESYGSESIELSLPYRYDYIECGDYISLEVSGLVYTFKVTQKEISEYISLSATSATKSIYGGDDLPEGPGFSEVDVTFTETFLRFIDLPLLPGETENNWQPKISAWQEPWPGSVNLLEDDGSGGYTLREVVSFPSVMGETVGSFPSGVTDRYDRVNTLTVQLFDEGDNLADVSEISLLNGANTAAVLTPSGEFEVIQFQDATLNPDGTYTLSTLLRGQLGTEAYMGDPTPDGSLFVMVLPERFSQLDVALDKIGVETPYRYGPGNLDFTDDLYQDVNYTPKSTAFRPYAPVHLQESKDGNDFLLSWVRRDRLNSDSWEQVEIPLSESFEAYEVDILDGSTVVRTLSTNSTQITYTSAQQIEDFGSVQPTLSWNVYQMSASYGRGTPANG